METHTNAGQLIIAEWKKVLVICVAYDQYRMRMLSDSDGCIDAARWCIWAVHIGTCGT